MSAGTFDALMGDVLRSQLLEHASELPWDFRWFGNVCRHNFNVDASVEDSPTNQDWIDLMEALEMRRHMLDVDALSVEGDELEATLSRVAQYLVVAAEMDGPGRLRTASPFPRHFAQHACRSGPLRLPVRVGVSWTHWQRGSRSGRIAPLDRVSFGSLLGNGDANVVKPSLAIPGRFAALLSERRGGRRSSATVPIGREAGKIEDAQGNALD
ncbi:hypothetical protein DAPPUDRAFT_114651 [Daphnia pulex]|uniref:Uncharacterized protein n=1 Tax=Daphnia pulex TaxID=6669 RepID=E9HIV3_DAPPU|nr:hypothetical protein DAPPUDRAFT_114651 [Daphnia pulex]|eukprot:EFX68344.1 hypothetical protein DAPPUDRAFT_114651 [Daphnia pulex]